MPQTVPAPAAEPTVLEAATPPGIQLFNRDFMVDVANLPDAGFDLILADPPYGLGKDYGNDSDKLGSAAHLAWTFEWL